jgi:hypothetical protein
MVLDICNIADDIAGLFTEDLRFSPSIQILMSNIKSEISIPHSTQSTFAKQQYIVAAV